MERSVATRGRARHGVSVASCLFFINSIGGQVLSQHTAPFTCQVSREGGLAIVAPRGELDMATVGVVEAEMKQLRRAGVGQHGTGDDFVNLRGRNLQSPPLRDEFRQRLFDVGIRLGRNQHEDGENEDAHQPG